ncbi:hypothetical protein [Streptomyces sp. TE5632]
MSATDLVRGVGSFFKECEHPRSRWSKCPHPYKIRYRSTAGKQVKGSGFATQDKAIARLAEVCNAKKAAPRGQAKAERIAKYGAMRFEEYAARGEAGRGIWGRPSVGHLESLLSIHLLPLLGSRRMSTFDHKVVEAFLLSMERDGVGLAARANAFDKLKAILLDAYRLGLFDDDPVSGVKPPQYDPKRVVIPHPGGCGTYVPRVTTASCWPPSPTGSVPTAPPTAGPCPRSSTAPPRA